MILTVLAEAPPLASLVRDRGLLWAGDNYNMYNSSNEPSGIGRALVSVAGSVNFRHAVAVGLFVVGFVRQHEAIRHLASLRGARGRGGDGKVRGAQRCMQRTVFDRGYGSRCACCENGEWHVEFEEQLKRCV